jgi:hypothetical protein
VSEVAERGLQLAVFVMIQRLFFAADRGDRGYELLRMAILREDAGTSRQHLDRILTRRRRLLFHSWRNRRPPANSSEARREKLITIER